MKRVKVFYFKNLRNGEHVQLHGSIISLLREKLLGRLGLTTLWSDYLSAFAAEDARYQGNFQVEETKEIEEGGDRRDTAFKRLKCFVDAAMLSENVEEQTDGKLLKNVFDTYKYVYLKSYVESTAEVTNLVEDLQQPPYSSAVERLGLSEAVETLSARNEDFANLYNERSVERHAMQMRGTMPEIRRRVDKAYRALAEGVNALYASNELSGKNADVRLMLTDLIEAINSYVEQAGRVYCRRAGKNKEEKKVAETYLVPYTLYI
jgi:hypothetical protein